MSYEFKAMTANAARHILGWRYEAPYDLYNLEPEGNPQHEVAYFCDPQNRYYGIWHGERLLGFCCFGPEAQVPGGDYSSPALDIGIGIDPDLTGQGGGAAYVKAVLDFARQHFAPKTFRATIAAFNERAQRACRRNGLMPVQTFHHAKTQQPFIVLIGEA